MYVCMYACMYVRMCAFFGFPCNYTTAPEVCRVAQEGTRILATPPTKDNSRGEHPT